MSSNGRLNTISFSPEQIQGLTEKARLMDRRCSMLESMVHSIPSAIAYVSPTGEILMTSQIWDDKHLDASNLRLFIRNAIHGLGLGAGGEPRPSVLSVTQNVRLGKVNGSLGSGRAIVTAQRWTTQIGVVLGLVLMADDVLPYWTEDSPRGNQVEHSSTMDGQQIGAL